MSPFPGYGDGDAYTYTYTVTTFSTTGYFAASSVPAINAIGRQNMKLHGALACFDAGYNFQSGNLVFGVSGDISKMLPTKGHQTSTQTNPCCALTAFTVTLQASMDMMGRCKAASA